MQSTQRLESSFSWLKVEKVETGWKAKKGVKTSPKKGCEIRK